MGLLKFTQFAYEDQPKNQTLDHYIDELKTQKAFKDQGDAI